MSESTSSPRRRWAEPTPGKWLPWLLVGVLLIYWLFARSLERIDMEPAVALFWQNYVPVLPLPGLVVFFVELLHPRVLRHLIPIVVGWVLAQRATVSMVQSLYQMANRPAAADFLRRLRYGGGGETIKLSAEMMAQRQQVVLLRVGGPGFVRVQAGEAAVTEMNGRFRRVLGPGKHQLDRFEYVLKLLDLRSQERSEPGVKLVTKDGIELFVDLHISYRLDTGGEPATPANPYPYSDEAVRKAAYAHTILPNNRVADWSSLPVRLAKAKLVHIVSQYRLDEILQLTNRIAQPYLAIQNELTRRVRRGLNQHGISLISVFIDRMELPEAVTSQYIRFWQVDWETRQQLNEAEGQAQAMEEMEIARAEAEMTMIQAIIEGVQRARRDGHAANMSEIVALRLVDAMEQMARQSQQLYPLPSDLLPQLWEIRQQLLPENIQTAPGERNLP